MRAALSYFCSINPGTIWQDVTAIDQVLPEAALPASSLEVD
jgi:hypothetical protein